VTTASMDGFKTQCTPITITFTEDELKICAGDITGSQRDYYHKEFPTLEVWWLTSTVKCGPCREVTKNGRGIEN
jgi:hypothetical protein